MLTQKIDPDPAPRAPKDFKKKGEESNGIIAMIDLLIKDLDKELTEAEFTEKDAQEDYKSFMSDSAIDTESTKTDFQVQTMVPLDDLRHCLRHQRIIVQNQSHWRLIHVGQQNQLSYSITTSLETMYVILSLFKLLVIEWTKCLDLIWAIVS